MPIHHRHVLPTPIRPPIPLPASQCPSYIFHPAILVRIDSGTRCMIDIAAVVRGGRPDLHLRDGMAAVFLERLTDKDERSGGGGLLWRANSQARAREAKFKARGTG
jgi:hypothetical protein